MAGAATAFLAVIVRLSRRDSGACQRFRRQLAQASCSAWSCSWPGDIVRTVAASPSLTSVAVLAASVLIRTFLS